MSEIDLSVLERRPVRTARLAIGTTLAAASLAASGIVCLVAFVLGAIG